MGEEGFTPDMVLDYWFPDDGHWETEERHIAYWDKRMQGGCDAEICDRFGPLTEAAAAGRLDHWADTPRGRLALLIALDQFPRSYWRGTPAAYAQDMKACRLVLEALENGHYHALPHPWERQFYIIALSHCEGPDHAARMDLAIELAQGQAEIVPPGMEKFVDVVVEQSRIVQSVIARFGRHPHRNAVLGRPDTDAERPYLDEGKFPHERLPELALT